MSEHPSLTDLPRSGELNVINDAYVWKDHARQGDLDCSANHTGDWFKPPHPERVCPECTEISHLRTLVAELLYKNQILRFDLNCAQEQLKKTAVPVEIGRRVESANGSAAREVPSSV